MASNERSSQSCKPSVHLKLNVSAGATVPAVVNEHQTTFGLAEAKQRAGQLIAKGSVCSDKPSAAIKQALARIPFSASPAAIHSQLQRLIASVKSRRSPAAHTASFAHPRRLQSAGCPNQDPTISVSSAPKVGDYLAIAAAALRAHDEAAYQSAMAAADSAFSSWAEGGASGAHTVGDWESIKQAAMQLGLSATEEFADGKAQAQALADVNAAAQADPCTVSKSQFDCLVKTLATAQMVGADPPEEIFAQVGKLAKAIDDRYQNIAPAGCEEWTLQMTISAAVDGGSSVVLSYPNAEFRVNRDTGQVQGVAASYPGSMGQETGECTTTDENGNTVVIGPATIEASDFHYAVTGSATSSEIELTLPSSDLTLTIDAPSDPACQALKEIAQGLVQGLLRNGLPAIFEVTASQATAQFQESSNGTTISATITRKPVVRP